mmetsp:Transcript_51869/g.57950  ORF Transcript_51869/g.57950 Transcript_51869/m.57950 type:complete len:122 (-) Transcript_51869:1852-2217(-)
MKRIQISDTLLCHYATFSLEHSFRSVTDLALRAISTVKEEMDRRELIDSLLTWSILPKRLAHSLLETSDSCNTPHVIIMTEITPSAVCLEIDSVEMTANATATFTIMLGTVIIEPRDSGGM